MKGKENNSAIKYNKEDHIKKHKKHQMKIAIILFIIEIIIILFIIALPGICTIICDLRYATELNEGDYIEYDVEYTDAYTNIRYTKNNGWRVCNPGKHNLDGTYSGVELISTGIPIRLYYASNKIVEADGVKNYPWKLDPKSQEMNKLREKEKYNPLVFSSAGGMAAGGLHYNFAKMQVLPDDPGGNYGYETGAVWRKYIVKNGVEITGTQSVKDIFVIKGKTTKDGIECTGLNSMKKEIEREHKIDMRNGIINIAVDLNTDETELARPCLNFKNPKNGSTVWNANNPDSIYWLAAPSSKDVKDLRHTKIYPDHEKMVEVVSSPNGNYGLRPIIKLKNHAKIKKIG